MKRSIFFQTRIAELRAVLDMVSGSEWAYFQEDFVKPMDEAAFKAWKKTPAENHLDIIEAQQQGKLADAIRAWPERLEKQIEAYALELQAIENGEAEDPEEGMAA
mgnify:CR=1 FL=1